MSNSLKYENSKTREARAKSIDQFSAYLRLLLINILVFVGFCSAIEFAHRMLAYAGNCAKNNICSGAEFTFYPLHYAKTDLNLTVYDKDLGYVPAADINININVPGWQNIDISHDHKGLRTLMYGAPERANVLVVGDSFAYGAQVSDRDTWQSCLNQNNQLYNFHNGAVPGYGTAQSVLRAKELFRSGKYQLLAIQTLVGHDLERDQLKAKWGLVRPFFTFNARHKSITQNNPLPEKTPGTKYGNTTASFGDYVYLNITLLKRFPLLREVRAESIERIQNSVKIRSLNPAPVDEILEWSIKKSLQISPKPIWILQYSADLNSDHVQKERRLFLEKLSNYKIQVIDTFDILNSYIIKGEGNSLWQGHHTPQGNRVVCESIMSNMSTID